MAKKKAKDDNSSDDEAKEKDIIQCTNPAEEMEQKQTTIRSPVRGKIRPRSAPARRPVKSKSAPQLHPSSRPHSPPLLPAHTPWSPPRKHGTVQHPDQWWDDYTLNHAAKTGQTQGRGGGTPTSTRKLKTQRAGGQQAANGMSYEELRESLRVRGCDVVDCMHMQCECVGAAWCVWT